MNSEFMDILYHWIAKKVDTIHVFEQDLCNALAMV